MRIGWVILCAGMGSSMAAQAEDMKTLAGQIYSNVVVKSYDREGYSIRHDGGTNVVPYSEISAEGFSVSERAAIKRTGGGCRPGR